MTKTGVIHGRFQILHNDHLKYLLAGKSRCDYLVVGITNPDPTLTGDDCTDVCRSRPEANPLTYYERYLMVCAALSGAGLGPEEFAVVPFPINFPELYRYYVPLGAVFYLTIYDEWGEKKLEVFKTLGLKTEVLWRKPSIEKGLTSTKIRSLILEGKEWRHHVPPSVVPFIEELHLADRMNRKH